MTKSLNNRLILETYKTDGSIKSEVKNGFAFAQQKSSVVGLRVLVDASIQEGLYNRTIPVGSKVYLLEEALHTQPWAKKILTSDATSEPFIIVNVSDVQFVVEKE